MGVMTIEDARKLTDLHIANFCTLRIPESIPGVDFGAGGKELDMLCTVATTPTKTINHAKAKIKGFDVGRPSNVYEYDGQITITCLDTEDSVVFAKIAKWMAQIIDPSTGAPKADISDLVSDMELIGLKSDRKTPYGTWRIYSAFPGVLPGITYDSANGELTTMDIVFNYLTFDYFAGQVSYARGSSGIEGSLARQLPALNPNLLG